MNEQNVGQQEKPLHERVWDVIMSGPEEYCEEQNILFEIYHALERNDNDIDASRKDLEGIRSGYEERINGNEYPIVHIMIARLNSSIEKLQTISEWC